MRDYPRKSIWGINLYRAGIHFQDYGEVIKGFYLSEGEDESVHGSPIRICFTGRFLENTQGLFFDVYIYPNIIELLFFVFAFISMCAYGDVPGFIISALVLSFLAKGYYDMMNDTYKILRRIFN